MLLLAVRSEDLSELDKQVILQQAKAVYETSSTKGEYKFIDKLEIAFSEQKPYAKPIDQQEQKLVLPQGIWGNILQKLIEEFGLDTYRNWFSRLSAKVNDTDKSIELKASNEYVTDWIRSNYENSISGIATGFGIINLSIKS